MQQRTRLEATEAWWPVIARIAAFALGACLLVIETLGEARTQVLAAALTLLVPPAVAVARALLTPAKDGER